MLIKLVRKLEVTEFPRETYFAEMHLPDGRKYAMGWHIGNGLAPTESDQERLDGFLYFESRVQKWGMVSEDDEFQTEEAEIEVSERELEQLVRVGSPIGAAA